MQARLRKEIRIETPLALLKDFALSENSSIIPSTRKNICGVLMSGEKSLLAGTLHGCRAQIYSTHMYRNSSDGGKNQSLTKDELMIKRNHKLYEGVIHHKYDRNNKWKC